jgi:nicotinamidase-related amidase
MATAVLLIDVQRNMLEPPEPVPAAGPVGEAIADVLGRARAAGALVVHVRNNGPEGSPDAPGSPGWALVHDVREGEHVVDKWSPDSFEGTELDKLLPPGTTLVVVGMQSEYCVRATSLAALSSGHQVTVVRDAHATYDDGVPAAQTARRVEDEMRAAGALVIATEDLRFD